MKILITGGAGFIGTNLVNRLTAAGYEIKVFDLFLYGENKVLEEKGVEIVKGDVTNREDCIKVAEGVDAIVHLAAQTEVVGSVKDPVEDFEKNATGVFNMLYAAKENNVKKFVFASSIAVIGDAKLPITEDQMPSPKSPYGASKLTGENYCWAFNNSYGMEANALRFTNVYGPFSAHKKSIIIAFIQKILNNEPLIVFGDGSATRDYVHVEDVCQAIQLSLEKDVTGKVFHIGNGIETSINDLIEDMKPLAEGELKVEYRKARAGEIDRNYVDISKAKEELGYEPKMNLVDGLKQTFEWFNQ